jgi:transposase
LVIGTDRLIVDVAGDIGVSAQLLGKWVKLERARLGPEPERVLDVSERAELVRLRKEVAELRLDNQFLGKAAAFFASRPGSRGVSS